MSLLSSLKTILATLKIPAETGVFSSTPAPGVYCVLVPLGESLECADDIPECEVPSVRISLFAKGAYTTTARSIREAVIVAGHTITESRYIGHEDDTGYNHYIIDVEECYSWEE